MPGRNLFLAFVAASTDFMRDRKRIIERAARHRLPAMYEWPEQVEDGGLVSCGGDPGQTTRRVAEYVDRPHRAPVPRGAGRPRGRMSSRCS